MKEQETALKEKIDDLRRQLQKEKEKSEEMEELVAKNLMLYEHEAGKTTTLHKEWTKEKTNATHYKKRYTRSKETNEKRNKIIKELEATVQELTNQIRVQDI